MYLLKEFKEFLKEYKIIALAIAFVMGLASKDLVNSLVKDVIMPTITPFVPEGAWQSATISIGPIVIRWGSFLGEVVNFLIIAFVAFIVVKKILKKEKVKK